MDAALRAIAEPHRREIIRLVWSTELPAGEIADRFREVSRPAISQHLRVLRDAGLLSERRDGTRRLYRARRDRIQQLRAYLDGFWSDRLGALKTIAEREAKRKRS
ncbi:MAG TPA: metalloregulator ArsR/SmtB family transcription factor [Candidatus Limnocylindria bacterium]|nr:metalloregulator ArsR/SmtB family transcription factor [Candidatus Limnocylindria bacterium]